MPAETPTVNSTRVLRAYRLNNVENVLLRNRVLGLNKEKRREIRLKNQDIRLIQLTLDFIKSSSGHSPEGRPPSYVAPKVERDDSPFFLYGDRVKSRKYSKQKRAQSAQVSFGRSEIRDESQEEVENLPENDEQKSKPRPKSSPAVRTLKHGSVSNIHGFRPAETGIHIVDQSNGGVSKTKNSSKNDTQSQGATASSLIDLRVSERDTQEDFAGCATQSVASQATTVASTVTWGNHKRPGSSKARTFVTAPSPSPELATRPKLSHKKRLSSSNYSLLEETEDVSDGIPASTHFDQSESRRQLSRGGRSAQSGRTQKAEVPQAWAPPGTLQKAAQVMAYKGQINRSRQSVLQDKLDAFKMQYPAKRY